MFVCIDILSIISVCIECRLRVLLGIWTYLLHIDTQWNMYSLPPNLTLPITPPFFNPTLPIPHPPSLYTVLGKNPWTNTPGQPPQTNSQLLKNPCWGKYPPDKIPPDFYSATQKSLLNFSFVILKSKVITCINTYDYRKIFLKVRAIRKSKKSRFKCRNT